MILRGTSHLVNTLYTIHIRMLCTLFPMSLYRPRLLIYIEENMILQQIDCQGIPDLIPRDAV